MIWLRLNRLQLALTALAVALLVAAVAVVLLPSPALPEAAVPTPNDVSAVSFEVPLYAIANDPESPLVSGNPFDASRRPPDRRYTAATAAEDTATTGGPPVAPVSFTLKGTVVLPDGRNIAVIQGNPAFPQGANYHVGDEVMPGYRLSRITRDGATIEGHGLRFDLEIQKPTLAPQEETEELE